MPKKNLERVIQRAQQRIEGIKAKILALDYACSGTLLRRMKKCGKAGCRCADDPEQRHGPYFEWSYREKGRLVHRVVDPEQAGRIRAAISNNRAMLKLFRAWERETRRVLEAYARHNP
jgi:hypothetical protein